DVVRREIARGVRPHRAALGRDDGVPGGEEDHRPHQVADEPEDHLHPILDRVLKAGQEEGAVGADHGARPGSSEPAAPAGIRSPLKTRSITSSIGGSSTEKSARWVWKSRTRRAAASGAPSRGTRRTTRPSSEEATSP